jgi:integrase
VANVQKRGHGKWRARYRDPAGKEHTRHFERKIDAEQWARSQESAINRSEWVDPVLARVTIREWSQTWLASKAGLKPTSRRGYEMLWRVHVEPRWGDLPLTAVTYADAVAWVAQLTGEGISASWVRQALLCLKQILDLAVLDGRLPRNVVAPVKAPRPAKGEQRFLTHEQLANLADECDRIGGSHYRAMILLLGYTGLRFGELRALRVKRLDLVRSRLEVVENLPDGFSEAQPVPPKSHERRTVPFPRFLADVLAPVVAGRRPADLVFTSSRGGALDNSNFRRNVFDRAASACGLAPLTPHDLRDTAASLAVSADANVKAVQRMLGHASAAMTLDVYASLFADDLDAVADQLNAAALAAHECRRDASVSHLQAL